MGLIQIIKGSPLFTELYDEEIDFIVRACQVRVLEKGDILFQENEAGEELFIVLSGELCILKGGVEITRFVKGELLGELVLVNDHQRTTACIAGVHSEVLVIHNKMVLGLYAKQPRIFAILMMNIARMLAQRLKKTTQQLKDLTDQVKKPKAA
jgi:CRP-like cAMP-binding protein